MSSLYELTNEYRQIYESISDPDVDEESFSAMLALIVEDIHDKADSYAKVIKSVEGDIESVKTEIGRLTDKKKSYENKIQLMKQTLQTAMETCGDTKFKTALFSFNIQNNPATCEFDVEDMDKIPKKYHIKQEDKIDKKQIIADLKDEKKAKALEGIAHLVQGQSLRIK